MGVKVLLTIWKKGRQQALFPLDSSKILCLSTVKAALMKSFNENLFASSEVETVTI